MKTTLASIAYVAALLLANLIVAALGPVWSPVLAFVFIGFDLTMRDWLHVRLPAATMLALIVVAGALTYIVNHAAGTIAIASSVAFVAAAASDWAVFAKLQGTWLKRSVWSNVAGAAVDSIVFPWIAFGAFLPAIVLLQFVAKASGGAAWAWTLRSAR